MRDDLKQAIFGLADGLTSALGVTIPLALAHQPMLGAISGLAICSALGMSGGLFLSEEESTWRSVSAMGLASFGGSVLPALPFFALPYLPASIVSAALCVATLVAIAETRAKQIARRSAYLQTFSIMVVASVATVAFAFATGAAG